MDLLEDIRRKLPAFHSHDVEEGVKAAMRHVEVAERWLLRGRDDKDEDLFNDVIYRTNQAFEGMLKEAFTVLAGQDGSKLSTFKIEKHLIDNNVLSDRVASLFTNYRQEWRNKSTHDHKLFFNEQEALLAIVSVSAFATILIDQIVETINAEREKADVEKRKTEIVAEVSKSKGKTFREDVLALLELFSSDMFSDGAPSDALREVEVIGKLVGFIQAVDPEIDIVREPVLSKESRSRADLILSRGGTKVLIEVKRGAPSWPTSHLDRGLSQVYNYMQLAGIKHGILYVSPYSPDVPMKTGENVIGKGNSRRTIDYVAPDPQDA